jgi:hypothetical protein
MAPEKSHEKIKSQYERHERQQNQGPIRIAVGFWRGLATRKENAKDTIAPQMAHGSSSGGSPQRTRNCQGAFLSKTTVKRDA